MSGLSDWQEAIRKITGDEEPVPKVVVVQDTDTLNAMLNAAMQEVEHEHQWQDTGFADLDDCALCGITRPHPEEGPPA